MIDVVIIGAGGQGLVVADILLSAAKSGVDFRPIGFVADDAAGRSAILGIPILGDLSELSRVRHDAIIVAIGDNATRRILTFTSVAERAARMKRAGFEVLDGSLTVLSIGGQTAINFPWDLRNGDRM